MTILAQIEVLESLAAVDAQLKDLNDALTEERKSLQGKQTHLADLDDRFQRGQKSSEEMEKMRGDLVGEVRQMALQIDRSREKLPRCRSEREANAVQRELEELRKLYRDREQEIEKIDTLLSQAREEASRVGAERAELGGELGKSQGQVLSQLGEMEKSVAEKQRVREELAKRVEPSLFRRYELLRKRKGSAIAHTTNGTCSACNMQIRPMLFQQLLRGDEFGQCPSCNRILYFREARESADGQQENA